MQVISTPFLICVDSMTLHVQLNHFSHDLGKTRRLEECISSSIFGNINQIHFQKRGNVNSTLPGGNLHRPH